MNEFQRLLQAPLAVSMCAAVFFMGHESQAITLQEPVKDAIVTQKYSCKRTDAEDNCFSDEKYHTGIDMVSLTDDTHAVQAAGPGVLRRIDNGTIDDGTYVNCNHGMGNVVIIDHGNRTYSLYAHLKEILVSHGKYVKQGDRIGTYGNTGAECLSEEKRFAEHLHFEIKTWNVMGSLHDDDGLSLNDDINGDGVVNTEDRMNWWGYAPSHPNLHGYINPYPYIFDKDIDSIEDIEPTVIRVADASSVHTGPNPEEAGPEFKEYASFATVTDGQRFVLSRIARIDRTGEVV